MATERVKLLDPVAEAADAKTIAARYRCEYVDLREASIDHDLFRSIPVDLMFRYNFVPMHAKNGTLEIAMADPRNLRSEEHTSELQSQFHLVCRLLLEKK